MHKYAIICIFQGEIRTSSHNKLCYLHLKTLVLTFSHELFQKAPFIKQQANDYVRTKTKRRKDRPRMDHRSSSAYIPMGTAMRHSHVGHPSSPHLYPSSQEDGQEKAVVHLTGCLTTSTTVRPTTVMKSKCNDVTRM